MNLHSSSFNNGLLFVNFNQDFGKCDAHSSENIPSSFFLFLFRLFFGLEQLSSPRERSRVDKTSCYRNNVAEMRQWRHAYLLLPRLINSPF
jgi:hypothetical protein